MLVQKSKEIPYISLFKINSGEEIICRVVEETDSAYVVYKPCMLAQGPGGQLHFVPAFMLADMEKNSIIPKPVIVMSPREDVASQYEGMISGIVLPSTGAIIT